MADDAFPSGPWHGYYVYQSTTDRHRMNLCLEFGNGIISGEGTDDIGAFVIRGRYSAADLECHWTKTYVGKHAVYYHGYRENKGIWGTWELGRLDRGGFKIWPQSHGDGSEDSVSETLEQPVDAVGELIGA